MISVGGELCATANGLRKYYALLACTGGLASILSRPTKLLAPGTLHAEHQAMVVSEIMTTDPVTITAESSVSEALEAMADLNIRHLPVTEEGALSGMLSDRDLAALRNKPGALDSTTVADLMSGDVACVDPESDVSDVIEIMLEAQVGAVPVVSAESQQVVGIVSYVDVLRSHAALLGER